MTSRQIPRIAPARDLPGKLGREYVDALDHRRRGQQIRRLLTERSRHGSGEMRVPPGFVGERIEDAERRWTDPKAEPDGRCRLCLNQRETTPKKSLDLRFLAGLGLQPEPIALPSPSQLSCFCTMHI